MNGFLTTGQVARVLGVNPATVRKLVLRNRLDVVRSPGGRALIRHEAIAHLIYEPKPAEQSRGRAGR